MLRLTSTSSPLARLNSGSRCSFRKWPLSFPAHVFLLPTIYNYQVTVLVLRLILSGSEAFAHFVSIKKNPFLSSLPDILQCGSLFHSVQSCLLLRSLTWCHQSSRFWLTIPFCVPMDSYLHLHSCVASPPIFGVHLLLLLYWRQKALFAMWIWSSLTFAPIPTTVLTTKKISRGALLILEDHYLYEILPLQSQPSFSSLWHAAPVIHALSSRRRQLSSFEGNS